MAKIKLFKIQILAFLILTWIMVDLKGCIELSVFNILFFIHMTNERSFRTELCMWESHRFNVAIFHLKDLSITCLYSYINLYSIVASTNTCYYSENQIFCFLKSRIVTCWFFFRKKPFLFVEISLRYSGYLTNTCWETHVFVK